MQQENVRVGDGLRHQIHHSKRREGYSSVCEGQHIESDRGSADFKGLVRGLVSPCIFNAYQTQQLRLTGMRISKPPAPASGKPIIFKADAIQQLGLFKPIHH
jgi:hypothetical protein